MLVWIFTFLKYAIINDGYGIGGTSMIGAIIDDIIDAMYNGRGRRGKR